MVLSELKKLHDFNDYPWFFLELFYLTRFDSTNFDLTPFDEFFLEVFRVRCVFVFTFVEKYSEQSKIGLSTFRAKSKKIMSK